VDLVRQVDRVAEYESSLRPGMAFNRTHAIKMLLSEALSARARK
jgi:hypothetical protein